MNLLKTLINSNSGIDLLNELLENKDINEVVEQAREKCNTPELEDVIIYNDFIAARRGFEVGVDFICSILGIPAIFDALPNSLKKEGFINE